MKKIMMLAVVVLTPAVSLYGVADDSLVKKGEYIARAGDCVACHTSTNGKPFSGGLPFDTPIGRIYSTNITPDVATGIGSLLL